MLGDLLPAIEKILGLLFGAVSPHLKSPGNTELSSRNCGKSLTHPWPVFNLEADSSRHGARPPNVAIHRAMSLAPLPSRLPCRGVQPAGQPPWQIARIARIAKIAGIEKPF